MNGEIIDLSHPLTPATPVYPGDDGVVVEAVATASEPTPQAPRTLNVGRLAVGLHNGTHLDAPFHFFPAGTTIDQLELSRCCGPGLWIDLRQTQHEGVIDEVDLQPHRDKLAKKKKVLLHTGWDSRWGKPEYFTNHPVLTARAAELIVRLQIDLVGVDFPSVDLPPFPAHVELLGNDLLIVENLTRIASLGESEFSFFAAPLAIAGRDASPVRAFAVINRK